VLCVDWYESTGELLGEGAFGHVATYHHNRSDKEFAVKVMADTASVGPTVFRGKFCQIPWASLRNSAAQLLTDGIALSYDIAT